MVAEPVSRLVDLEELDEPLERIIERAAESHERIVIRRHGSPLALVVPAGGVGRPPGSDWDEARAVLTEASHRFSDVPWPEVERRIEEAVDGVRTETWRARQSAE